MFKLLQPRIQPPHPCLFHGISSRAIWQGKLELGSLCSWKRQSGFTVPCSATAGTPVQRARAGSRPGKHWSFLIQIDLASNGTERGHALSSLCFGVSSIWLKVRVWGWDCQKLLTGVKACTSRTWILPQPLNPGLPWVWHSCLGCGAVLNAEAKEQAEWRSSQ